jgi:hypothetical protein
MGTYETKYEAQKRVKQIEMFKNIEEDKEPLKEGYFSQLAANEEYPIKKKIKLTDSEKIEKKKREEEFRQKFIVPIKKKRRNITNESTSGLEAPDIRPGKITPSIKNVMKLQLRSERTMDMVNMYGDSLEKGKEDKQSDEEAREYLGESQDILAKYGVDGYNKPKRTPEHKTKSHLVVAKKGDQSKVVRFGAQGVQGSPKKEGETEEYKNRREAFVARHKAQNPIGLKDKFSALYWANKVKW